MSYFDDASLVMIPSGYKTSKVYSVKPTDGTGDLTFTRSNDTATRVGPDGLIEKVRTNLLLQSNSFDTTWNLVNGSLTSGQSGYDGTSNAWLLAKNATAVAIVQNIAVAGLQSFSTYAKAGTTDWVRLGAGGGTFSSAYFDLTNGVVGATTTNIVSASISSVGSGWYRCTIVVNKTINAVYIYPAEADNDVSATSGNIVIQATQLETGDIATDYIATTSAAVSVGPVANVPRLDYLGSSCPRLLLEPQRTNSILWSEQMNNWGPTNTTVTTNVLVSPDGYQNADTIVINDSTSRVSQNLSLGAGTYTASVYAKLTIGSGTVRINLIVDGVNSSFTFAPTNEWERYTYTVTAATGITAIQLRGSSGTSTVSFWGAQIEAGSYATSYIPTLGAAVTRGADACSKTGISSLIGQTEGVLFLEADIVKKNETEFYYAISAGGTLGDSIYIHQVSQEIFVNKRVGGVTQNIIVSSANWNSGNNKIAVKYTASEMKIFINGVLKDTEAISGLPSSLSMLTIGSRQDVLGVLASDAKYKQALLFPTALSDADAIALTA